MRLLGWLTRLYPARFREEYARQMELVWRESLKDAATPWERLKAWVGIALDFCASMPVELAGELRRDAVIALRMHLRRPWAMLAVLGTLAVALGVATGIFGVANALLLRSLPFEKAEDLYVLQGMGLNSQVPAGFHEWRKNSPYLADVAVHSSTSVNLFGQHRSTRVEFAETSANFFSLLGRGPHLGRAFEEGEDLPGQNGVAVISHSLWLQEYGGADSALGTTIGLSGVPHVIVGIAPPGFDYPGRAAVWTPTFFDRNRIPKSGAAGYVFTARARSGQSLSQLNASYRDELAARTKGTPRPGQPALELLPLRRIYAGPVREAGTTLLLAVASLLVLACANLANFFLSRIAARRTEISIRTALGASRARLMQQLTVEALLLTGSAAAIGLGLAYWIVGGIAAVDPGDLIARDYSMFDWRVALFAAAGALVTGILFGVFPAAFVSRSRIAPSTRGSRSRARLVFVGVQVAVTMSLLVASLGLGRELLRLLGTDLGFAYRGVATASVSFAGTQYERPEQRQAYVESALGGLEAPSYIDAVAAVDYLPLDRRMLQGTGFKVEGMERPATAITVSVTPGYFKTMRIPLMHGREFGAVDGPNGERSLIVNEALARQLGDPATLPGSQVVNMTGRSYRIVGVVGNVRFAGPQAETFPQAFHAMSQTSPNYVTFVARSRTNARAILPLLATLTGNPNRTVPVYRVLTLEDLLSELVAIPRFYTLAALLLGVFAVVVSVLGVYSSVEQSVSNRWHEIGVRLAVGARPAQVRALLIRQSGWAVVGGLSIGGAASFTVPILINRVVPNAGKFSPLWQFAVAGALAAVVLAAMWMASRRAARVQPALLLRAD